MKVVYFNVLLLFLAASCSMATGQDISGYNLYMINPYAINPAYTGNATGLYTLAHFKNQFSGISSAPRNLMLVAHSPLAGSNLGLGGNITVGQAGVFNTTSANVASSYRVHINREQRITFGLSGGFLRQTLNMDAVMDSDLSDPTLQSSYTDKTYYRFGYGATYDWNNLQLSLALPTALQQENPMRGYLIGMASYKLHPAGMDLTIQPSVLYKSLPVTKDQADVFVQAEWKSMVRALAGYRTNNNMIVGGGVALDNMNLGYAYEMFSGTRGLARGTHEVTLSFVFRKDAAVKAAKQSHVLDSRTNHIKELEAEVIMLKQQVGEQTITERIDSVNMAGQPIFSYDARNRFVKIYPGSYVVIQSCNTREFADRMVSMYKSRGIHTFKIYHQTDRMFYIIENYFPNISDARGVSACLISSPVTLDFCCAY